MRFKIAGIKFGHVPGTKLSVTETVRAEGKAMVKDVKLQMRTAVREAKQGVLAAHGLTARSDARRANQAQFKAPARAPAPEFDDQGAPVPAQNRKTGLQSYISQSRENQSQISGQRESHAASVPPAPAPAPAPAAGGHAQQRQFGSIAQFSNLQNNLAQNSALFAQRTNESLSRSQTHLQQVQATPTASVEELKNKTLIPQVTDEHLAGPISRMAGAGGKEIYELNLHTPDGSFQNVVFKPFLFGSEQANHQAAMRNFACSALADALNFNVIPDATVAAFSLPDDAGGTYGPVTGLVMGRAPGARAADVDDEDLADYQTIRELTKLQLLDYLVGRTNRQMHDYFVHTAEDGTREVTGIGNHDCFPADSDPASDRGPSLPPIIDAEMYSAVTSLSQEKLLEMLGDKLDAAEIQAASLRLSVLQDHVESLAKASLVIDPEMWGDPGLVPFLSPENRYAARDIREKRRQQEVEDDASVDTDAQSVEEEDDQAELNSDAPQNDAEATQSIHSHHQDESAPATDDPPSEVLIELPESVGPISVHDPFTQAERQLIPEDLLDCPNWPTPVAGEPIVDGEPSELLLELPESVGPISVSDPFTQAEIEQSQRDLMDFTDWPTPVAAEPIIDVRIGQPISEPQTLAEPILGSHPDAPASSEPTQANSITLEVATPSHPAEPAADEPVEVPVRDRQAAFSDPDFLGRAEKFLVRLDSARSVVSEVKLPTTSKQDPSGVNKVANPQEAFTAASTAKSDLAQVKLLDNPPRIRNLIEQ